jgi:hypothetical protein
MYLEEVDEACHDEGGYAIAERKSVCGVVW